jgi:hypothetical protein
MFQFVQFLRKKWTEYSPSSGAKGTVTDELCTKPAGLVLADFYNALVEQQAINDINNWQNMTDEQLDFFGNKFFIPRVQGAVAAGSIRIFFDAKQDIEITSTLNAQSNTGLLYKAVMPSIISKNSMQISNDTSAKYYVDVLIQALFAGANYNVDINQITSLVNASFTYKKVTNPEKISGGSVRETNEQYAQRLVYSINDRSMMNKRSLFANLRTYFPYVSSVYVAAPSDKYMTRDLVQALDLSVPLKKSEFLGKIQGDNSVNNSAYWGTFPPEAGSVGAAFRDPLSIYSTYQFPQSIEPINLDARADVGLHGYPLTQEATTQMYQGLYFDDYRNFMSVQTSDLFNIINENVSTTAITSPSSDWIIGANGRQNGDYGQLKAGLGNINIVQFQNNNITISAGSANTVTVSKDIKKRVGIKLSGTFKTPATESSYNGGLQFMVAGVDNIDDNSINAFTGIGFGIRITGPSTGEGGAANAMVYFAHSERYGAGQIFAAHDDFVGNSVNGFISTGGINALAEKESKLTPGAEYSFEFCLNDDLSLSLYLKKVSPEGNDPDDKFKPWPLSPTVLNPFSKSINDINSQNYGTLMRVTLDTKSMENTTDQWIISNLKAFDIASHRANALFIFDVQDLEAPLSISFRGSASGSINQSVGSGYSVYIWDTEQESPAGGTTALSIGGWSILEDISNPTGLKDSITTNLVQNLANIDQYVIESRFGTSIILLAVATGSSEAKIKANGNLMDDIYSSIDIDYVKIESELINQYHANNKSDVYVCTVQNEENLDTVITVVDKGPSESFFLLNKANGFTTPIESIKTVSISNNGLVETLAENTYKIIRSDVKNINSIYETMYLSLDNKSINEITIEYSAYRNINDLQNFYNSSEFSRLFGNILVRHKFPCYLNINILYTGLSAEEVVIDAVKTYVDANNDGIFSIPDMISYLYNQNIVNNVQIPLTISYSQYDDNMNIVTGSFTNTLQIRTIDFFRIQNITANKL